MRIFLAGIMQGSHLGLSLHNQDYRGQLKALLKTHLPACQIYDPLADHGGSVSYDDARGRQVFLNHNRMCGEEVDLVLAYVPEASMGTAIEIWEAHRAGRIVVSISPLIHNWAIRFLSDLIYPDDQSFRDDLLSGRFAEKVEQVRARKSTSA